MDADTAIYIGSFIKEAYQVSPDDLTPPVQGLQIQKYDVLSKIYANDLATDLNPVTYTFSKQGLTPCSLSYDAAATLLIRRTRSIQMISSPLELPCESSGTIGQPRG